MRIRLLFVTALTVAALAVGSTVQAAPVREVSAADRAAIVQAQNERDQVKVAALAPFYNTKTVSLDAKRALAAGVDATLVADFQKGLVAGRAGQGTQQIENSTTAAASCNGLRGARQKFLYYEAWMNSCGATTIRALLQAGAALGTLTGAIAAATGVGLPYTVAAAIAVALFGFGLAAVTYCSRYNRGMVARNVLWPPCYNQ